MTIKICTHPDGCQNEPRKCLAVGCQQLPKSEELTPEEKDAERYLKERYGTEYIPVHWIKTVAEYEAAITPSRAWYKDQFEMLRETYSSVVHLLKEAIALINALHDEYYIEGDELDLRVKKYLNTVTRKE